MQTIISSIQDFLMANADKLSFSSLNKACKVFSVVSELQSSLLMSDSC